MTETEVREIDTRSDQIVRWLREELANDKPRVSYSATREFITDDSLDTQIGELSKEAGVHALVTVGILDIQPVDTDENWRLTVRIEDSVGAHLPEDSSVSGYAEEIDLNDFQTQFTTNDNCTEFVSLKETSPEAMTQFNRIFSDIIEDRHRD